ncbi:MAG: hypothetical protein LC797_23505 [Chloroflexi bacterium]|nr:hypothetical protein [Chloroflexota bacterium]
MPGRTWAWSNLLKLIVVGFALAQLGGVAAAQSGPQPTGAPIAEDTWFTFGRSVDDRPLDAVRLGSGSVHLALMGSIHGGWERNTELLVRRAYEYFASHRDEIPADMSLYFVPTSNPDGLAAGSDRDAAWNANGVDLNRNFDTSNWSTDSYGQVGGRYGATGARNGAGGPFPFSEPESSAIRGFVLDLRMDAVLSYHSGIVSVTTRDGGGDPAEQLAREVASITGYPYIRKWTAYQLTGQFMDWLDTVGVKGIEIDLPNQQDIDWDKNLTAMRAVMAALATS